MPSTPLSAIAARKAKATSLSSSSPVTLRPAVPAPQLADLEHTIAASSPVTPKSGSTNGKNRNRDSKVAGGKSPANGSATHKRRQQAARYYGMESEAGPSAGASDVESSSDERNGAQEDEADEVEDHHMSDASSSLDFGLEEEVSAGRPKKRRRMENGDSGYRSLTSNFKPINGINIWRVTAEQLDAARVKAGLPEGSVIKKRGVIVSLAEGENLIISGTCLLTPLQQSISVFSSILHPTSTSFTSYPVFAPLTHPLPILQRAETGEQADESVVLAHLDDLPKSMSVSKRTTLLLQELGSGIEGMDTGAMAGFGRIWPEGKSLFGLRGCHPIIRSHLNPIYTHTTPDSWSSALSSLPSGIWNGPTVDQQYQEDDSRSSPLIAMVKGPKRSGKSTFAREVVNRLLNRYERVAYLDCDLGQSEFSCGGMVELHVLERPILGPSFTHPAQAVRSHFIGSLSPVLCAEAYLSSIAALLEHYRFEVQYPIPTGRQSSDRLTARVQEVIPLVVNTQGWVKGLGADLLAQIEDLVQATHTFAFQSDGAAGRDIEEQGAPYSTPRQQNGALLEEGGTTGSGQVINLSPIPVTPLLSKYTAAEFRILSTLAYLHSTTSSRANASEGCSSLRDSWMFDAPLVRRLPWQLDMSTIKEIYLTGEGADGVAGDDLALAVNGSIVALLERIEESVEDGDRYVTGRGLPPSTETSCLGLAVLRSVSPDLHTAHLLTPLDPVLLGRVSILVKGELELPVTAMLDWVSGPPAESGGLLGVKWEDVPLLQFKGAEGVGMGRRKWRRNIMRKGQMA